MKVELDFEQKECRVIKDDKKKYYTESTFFFDIKKELIKQGFDVIKKLMMKDGHMMGGETYGYYIRERKQNWCAFDEEYCIRNCWKDYSEGRQINLHIETWKKEQK